MTAVWALQWQLALSDRGRFVLGMLAPLAITASVATGVAGPEPAAAVYVVVFVSFSILGSALPLRWEGERGMVGRVLRGGVPAGRYLLAKAGAGATIDLAQLTPALVVAGLAAGSSPAALATAFAMLAVSVWVAGLAGAIAAAVSRSLAETGLVAALAVLVLARVSGVFESPSAGPLLAALEAISPFRALHETLLGLTVGASPRGFAPALAWAVLLPGLVWVLAGRLAEALGRVARGGLEGV